MDNPITPKEICQLIAICRKNNVAKIKFGSLEIDFCTSTPGGESKTSENEASEFNSHENPNTLETLKEPSPQNQELIAALKEEMKLNEAFNEDPYAYEQMIVKKRADEIKAIKKESAGVNATIQ